MGLSHATGVSSELEDDSLTLPQSSPVEAPHERHDLIGGEEWIRWGESAHSEGLPIVVVVLM